MTADTVELKFRGPVAWLALNRPDVMNALNFSMIEQLESHLADLASDSDIRVVVITGRGKAFCAGADLNDSAGKEQAPGEPDFIDRAEEIFSELRAFPKPTIVALNGLALAGGLELAMCCDLIVAAESAKVGDAHANFGVFPGAGGASVLPRLIPLNVAKYLLFTGEFLPADQMMKYGLINQVVADDQLQDAIQQLAEKIAEKSPASLRRMKAVANASQDKTLGDALVHEKHEFRKHERSYDMAEGLSAFVEKRKPKFKGY